MNKQIEEMAKDLQETHDYEGCDAWHCNGCEYEKYNGNYLCESIMQAERLISKGYRKQKKGEWIEDTEYYDDDYSECNVRKVFRCSKCGRTEKRKEPYCNCGARMKGGETDA